MVTVVLVMGFESTVVFEIKDLGRRGSRDGF